jgi:hypothetical protein
MKVDPEETANMRSFLDRPTTKGHTLKGSNMVDFHIHSQNSTTTSIRNIPALKRIFTHHLRASNKLPEHYNYDKITLIDNRISINGRWWKTGSECTYTTIQSNDNVTNIGKITSYAVVSYTLTPAALGARRKNTNTAMFVLIDQYTPAPTMVDGVYVCPTDPATIETIVHVDSLLQFLTRANARKRLRGAVNHRHLSTINLIPVSDAYVV